MANTKTQKTATKKSSTKTTKEAKVMAKPEVKAAENAAKVNTFISIEEIVELYEEAGIGCKNPTAKGGYRIMNGGSSLNLKPKKGYYIYTSNDDLANILSSGIKNNDLVVEQGTNAQDKKRPNTIICTTVETLKELLAVYAQNPLNKKVVEEKKVEQATA